MKYKAFISYSHAADNQLVPVLQNSLQQFCKPFWKLRSIRIFRDKTTLSITSELWQSIQNALNESEYFILMASPDAANSLWVEQEILEWLTRNNNSLDKLLIVLTAGEISWNKTSNDFNWHIDSPLPQILKKRFSKEPFYIDFRWAKNAKELSMRNPQFLDDVATIAATLHQRSKDEIIGSDVMKHNIFKTVTSLIIIILLALFMTAIFFAIQFKIEEKAAINQKKEAESQKILALKAANKEKKAREEEAWQRSQAIKAQQNEEIARIFAQSQEGIANVKQSEAEYLLAQSLVSQNNLPVAIALIGKAKFDGKLNDNELTTALRYNLPRLSSLIDQIKLLTPPMVFSWQGAVYYLDNKYNYTYLTESSVSQWGINNSSSYLFTIENEANLIIRSLPSLKIEQKIDVSDMKVSSLYDSNQMGKFVLLGNLQSASAGGAEPTETIFDLKKHDFTYLQGNDTHDYPQEMENILKDPGVLIFPKIKDESSLWVKVISNAKSGNTIEELNPVQDITESQVQDIKRSLKLGLLEGCYEFQQYNYKGSKYLFTHYSGGMQYGRKLILKVKNKQILKSLDLEYHGDYGETVVEKNYIYIRDLAYVGHPSFYLIDFSKMQLVEPKIYPAGEGPYEAGLSFNKSQTLFAITTNMKQMPEEDDTLNEIQPIDSTEINSEMTEDSSDYIFYTDSSEVNPEKKESDILIYNLENNLKKNWRLPKIINGQIVRIQFVGDEILLVQNSENEILAFDCNARKLLWSKQFKFNENNKPLKFQVNQNEKTIAVYGENKIVMLLARTGMALTDILNTETLENGLVKKIRIGSLGEIEIFIGANIYSRKILTDQYLSASMKKLENYTGVSMKNGLSYLQKLNK